MKKIMTLFVLVLLVGCSSKTTEEKQLINSKKENYVTDLEYSLDQLVELSEGVELVEPNKVFVFRLAQEVEIPVEVISEEKTLQLTLMLNIIDPIEGDDEDRPNMSIDYPKRIYSIEDSIDPYDGIVFYDPSSGKEIDKLGSLVVETLNLSEAGTYCLNYIVENEGKYYSFAADLSIVINPES